jgi:glycosyltransferase involved in cell wall biosynthesis
MEMRSQPETGNTQLKVLVSAFAYSPVKGSEFAIGWDFARAIAAHHQVWVIARSTEREETESYLRQNPSAMPNTTVHYIPWTDMQFNFPLWEIPFSILYRRWQWQAYQLASALDSKIGFDLIQQITATGFREPGFLWKIDKPFIWGPVGGLQYFPLHLRQAVPWRTRPFLAAKNVSTYLAMRSSRVRNAASRAKLIIAGTSEAAKRMESLWGKKAPVLCEVNAPDCASSPPRHQPGQKFRIIFSGSFEPRKALNIVLMALKKLNDASLDWELICLGSGPLESRWKTLAQTCGISERCTFTGKLPRAEAVSLMATGHCFVQPSLYDATSSVVVEALAMGLPVVCLDHFGFRDAVDSSCGIRITPGSLAQIVNDFAEAVRKLGRNEELRYELAVGAQKASTRLTWRYKSEALNELYRELIAEKNQLAVDSKNHSGNLAQRTVSPN